MSDSASVIVTYYGYEISARPVSSMLRHESLRTQALLSVVIAAALLLAGCGSERPNPQSGSGAQELWTFDEDPSDSLPEGAEVFSGTWEVRSEPDAPTAPDALCQTGEAEFPALVVSDATYTDVVLSTSFKPISGQQDQAAGLIFRVQDEDNYYIARANALEETSVFISTRVAGAAS